MHQFGWLSERGGGCNFLNLLQKEGDTQKGEIPSEKGGGVPTLEETMNICFFKNYASSVTLCLYNYIIYASLRIMLLLLHDRWIQHHALSSTSYVSTLPKVRNVSVIYL